MNSRCKSENSVVWGGVSLTCRLVTLVERTERSGVEGGYIDSSARTTPSHPRNYDPLLRTFLSITVKLDHISSSLKSKCLPGYDGFIWFVINTASDV